VALAIRSGLLRVPEIEIALVADLMRDYGAESEMATFQKKSGLEATTRRGRTKQNRLKNKNRRIEVNLVRTRG
jgi:hypothetical protein